MHETSNIRSRWLSNVVLMVASFIASELSTDLRLNRVKKEVPDGAASNALPELSFNEDVILDVS